MADRILPDDRPDKIRDMHGMHGTPEYQTWRNMLTRCYNPNSDRYQSYGGRGIRVCDRWRDSFRAFYEDMGDKPECLTLERKDVDGDYGPENCVWATTEEQARNTTKNRYVEYDGRSMILPDWEKETGIKRGTIQMRMDRDKWTVGQALGFDPPPAGKHRHVRLIEYDGKSMPMIEWARLRGIHHAAISTRIDMLGWTLGQALGFEPPPPRPGNSNSPGALKQRRYRERATAQKKEMRP